MKQTSKAILIAITSLILCTACAAKKEQPKAKLPVPVKVALALQKDVPIQVKAIGNIEAFTSVAIKSQVSGQIARVHFQEGSDVRRGDLLISIDPEPFRATLSQCEAALVRDQAQAKFAREQASRYQGLLKDGIVTRDQCDLLESTAASLAATVVADRATAKSARIQLGYCSIRSPVSGRTGTLALHPGNLVKANDLPIVTVNQVSPIYATFSIPEKLLAQVKRALAAKELKIEALIPNEPGSTELGTVSFLDSSVNAATGTIKLKGVFANLSRKLWPGQFADVVMTLGLRKNAVIVPTNTIQTGQQGQFVYVVKTDRSVEMRPVTLAEADGSDTVIEKGVAQGETIVVDGQLRLSPGALVDTGDRKPAVGKKQ
jgi:membrane fusion protein, multidrug efflux system